VTEVDANVTSILQVRIQVCSIKSVDSAYIIPPKPILSHLRVTAPPLSGGMRISRSNSVDTFSGILRTQSLGLSQCTLKCFANAVASVTPICSS
jgi:hypothetical protein